MHTILHVTFWCQKLAAWIILDSSAVVTTVNTHRLVSEVVGFDQLK
jgi:hypothetical protein